MSDLLQIAEQSIKRVADECGGEYALAAARIAYDGQFATALTKALAEYAPPRHAAHLIESLTIVLQMHAQCEAALLDVDCAELTADGLRIADEIDLGSMDFGRMQ